MTHQSGMIDEQTFNLRKAQIFKRSRDERHNFKGSFLDTSKEKEEQNEIKREQEAMMKSLNSQWKKVVENYLLLSVTLPYLMRQDPCALQL